MGVQHAGCGSSAVGLSAAAPYWQSSGASPAAVPVHSDFQGDLGAHRFWGTDAGGDPLLHQPPKDMQRPSMQPAPRRLSAVPHAPAEGPQIRSMGTRTTDLAPQGQKNQSSSNPMRK